MAVLIKVPETPDFEFQLKKGGKVHKLPSFGRFPVDRALKQADMTVEQAMDDTAQYVIEKCPALKGEDFATLGAVIAAWQQAAGVTPGE